VFHLGVELVLVLLELLAVLGVLVEYVHHVLVHRGEALAGLHEEFHDVPDVLGELVALGPADVDVLEHQLVDVGVDDLLQLFAPDDEVVQVEEEGIVHDVPVALALLPLLIVDCLELEAGFTYFNDLGQHFSHITFIELSYQFTSIQLPAGLGDDLIADQSDQGD